MNIASHQVSATNISDGWLRATRTLAARSSRAAFHLVVRFSQPTKEEPGVREAVDRLLDELNLQDVLTVANTIFPCGLADSSRDPEHLAERYRYAYEAIKKASSKNTQGTYFGRLIDSPPEGLDQFNDIISKLRHAIQNKRMKSIYEFDLAAPDLAMSTYAAEKDHRKQMGFPCLSHMSFHLDADALHLAAFYRSQYMIERGYGNYLGLGRLLGYVADQVEVPVGELLVVSGHACIHHTWGTVKTHLDRMPELRKDAEEGEQEDDDEA